MKRFLSVALIVCALSLVLASCGPDRKAIEAKVRYYVEESFNATLTGDFGRVDALGAEESAYYNGLSDKEKAIYNEAARAVGADLLEANGLDPSLVDELF